MAPPWVLLNRCVDLRFDEDDDESSSLSSAAAVQSMGGSGTKPPFVPAIYQATVAMLGSMKPDAVLLQPPPEIATFRLRASKSHQGKLSTIPLVACADKSLLVLYGGNYFGPGSSKCGCYLVYDAAASAARLTTVPPLPEARGLTRGVGSGAVVLRRHPGPSSPYLLAELATIRHRESPDDPDAALFLWRSDEQQTTPQWAIKEVHLPREVCRAPGQDKHPFYSDTSFSGPDGCLCWVDLLQGIVVCTNPLGPGDPELRFIALPEGCPAVSVTSHPYRPRAEENRSAACVRGRIKFVAMVGELVPGLNANHYRLTTWTLLPDLSGWQQEGVFPLKDLWATKEFCDLNLPPQTPVCPVLSVREDGIVYVLLNDIEEHPIVQGCQLVLGTELQFKRQYVLGIDVRRNKIVSTSSGIPPESLMEMMPRLLSIDFCASLHGGAMDRQRDVEECEVGDSGKRLKV